MEDRTCKTCDYNDDLLCDKKGIWITDDYSCNKWEFEQVTDWRDSMLAMKEKAGVSSRCGHFRRQWKKRHTKESRKLRITSRQQPEEKSAGK